MLDAVSIFLRDVASELGFADVLDILVVSVLLYAILAGIRRSLAPSMARRMIVVSAVFLLLYVLIQAFDLYLVEQLLEVLLVVFLVSAVVLFQSDLKRLLDRIGTWSLLPRQAPPATVPAVEILAETAGRLAETRTGALVALRGREPWDSLVTGGIALDGVVSKPLLYSIFHPETAGHDGAVLMEGERVTHFGAHLPLATTLPPASRAGGTRHAAALGLAQQCDALVVVVSEERGTVSVAREGRLDEMETVSDVKARLAAFWEEHYERPLERPRPWSRSGLQTAVLSLGLAAVLWLAFAYSPDTLYRTFEVPVEYRNLPAEWAFDDSLRSSARLTLAASEQAFSMLDPAALAVTLDLAEPREGVDTLRITEEQVRLPSDVRLERVLPEEIRVDARRLVRVRVPLEAEVTGELPDSLELRSVTTQPDSVLLLVRDSADAPGSVRTAPLDLTGVTERSRQQRRIELPPGTRLAPGEPQEATVEVDVGPPPEDEETPPGAEGGEGRPTRAVGRR